METLNMLQSFVRAQLSESDLGYLAKWLMKDYQNMTKEEYIKQIEDMLEMNFFDNNKKVREICNYYKNN